MVRYWLRDPSVVVTGRYDPRADGVRRVTRRERRRLCRRYAALCHEFEQAARMKIENDRRADPLIDTFILNVRDEIQELLADHPKLHFWTFGGLAPLITFLGLGAALFGGCAYGVVQLIDLLL